MATLVATLIVFWGLCLLHVLQPHTAVESSLTAVLIVVLVYLAFFAVHWLNRKRLHGLKRELTLGQQQNIAEYLRPYSPNRIVRIHCYPGVLDATDLGRGIQTVLQGLGWGCDIESAGGLWEPPSHSKGLWVYGEGKGDPAPPTCDLIQDAFRQIKLRVHYDPDPYGERGNVIAIGFWE